MLRNFRNKSNLFGFHDHGNLRDSNLWISKFPESQDYDNVESVEWRKHELRQFAEDDGKFLTRDRKSLIVNWILVTAVGIFCGAIGFAVHTATHALVNMKRNHTATSLLNGRWGEAFTIHFAYSLAFASAGYFCVFFDISAAGSGLPEVKSYLNGVNLEKIIRLKTLFCKSSSVIFTVASGLFAGPEGPMVHIGAIVGAIASHSHNRIMGLDSSWSKFNVFKSDWATRDFVTFGTAAGVAAAFRAPIGGVLFSLEEGASFWSTGVTWQAFFCTSVTLLTVSLIDLAVRYDGVNISSNFSFGKFSEVVNKKMSDYFLYELVLFFLIGCLGGIFGAIFVHLNMYFARIRMRYIADARWKRYVEIVIITMITGWATFTMPLMWRVCSDLPDKQSSFSKQEMDLIDQLVQFDCPQGQYNQVASLLYVHFSTAIKQLLHYREHMSDETFSCGSLLMMFIPHFILYCATCGVMASAGIFVPSLVSGACMGRFIGRLLNEFFPGAVADSGTYALIGSAALLGGVCRMTISLTVILVEVTGNLQFVLPLMLTLLAARYTGNIFSYGLYDQMLKVKQIPYLQETLQTKGLVSYCPVTEFMAQPVVFLNVLERVGNVYEALQATTHNTYPVLDDSGRLKGTISRATLCGLLQMRAFSVPLRKFPTDEEFVIVPLPGNCHEKKSSKIMAASQNLVRPADWGNFNKYATIDSIELQITDLKLWLDLRLHMDIAPYTVLESASVRRAYRMFRTLGLRHLIVIDGDCKVSGILTRKDLTSERFQSYIRDHMRHHSLPSKSPLPKPSSSLTPITQPLSTPPTTSPTNKVSKLHRGLNTLFGLEQLPPMTVKASDIDDISEDWEYAGFEGINSKSILSEIKRHNIKNGKLDNVDWDSEHYDMNQEEEMSNNNVIEIIREEAIEEERLSSASSGKKNNNAATLSFTSFFQKASPDCIPLNKSTTTQ